MIIDGMVDECVTKAAEVRDHVGVHELTGVGCNLGHMFFISLVVLFSYFCISMGALAMP